jgi:hypothetical protein
MCKRELSGETVVQATSWPLNATDRYWDKKIVVVVCQK